MAVLGQCPSSSSNFLAADPFISVNEVTTVAGVYALSGYMTDMLHVSSSGTALSNAGVANAFMTAANLADISSGSALATTPAGNGTAPQAKVNTIANVLAACIDSDGTVVSTPVPTSCYTLFSNATSDGTSSGTVPTETVTAVLNMVHNPGTNVANLYALQAGTAPFQPSLSGVTDFVLALNFTGGGVGGPTGIAIDGFGNVWTANRQNTSQSTGNSASKFAAGTGAALSPAVTGYTGGGISAPGAIAIDSLGNVWIGDASNGTTILDAHLTKLAEDGTPFAATGYDLGFAGYIDTIAIDNLGNAIVAPFSKAYKVDGATGVVTPLADNGYSWLSYSLATQPNGAIWLGVSNQAPGVLELDTTGTIVFPAGVTHSYFGPRSGLQNPIAVAIDHSGDIWVGNGGTVNGVAPFGVAEFSSSGALLSPPAFISNGAGDDISGYTGATSGIAIDGLGDVFISHIGNYLSELNNDGSAVTPYFYYSDSSLNGPIGIAVDGSGNVWVANYNGASVTEFVGIASPVVTPIAAGVANNMLGTRP
jgi:hypothetical protein